MIVVSPWDDQKISIIKYGFLCLHRKRIIVLLLFLNCFNLFFNFKKLMPTTAAADPGMVLLSFKCYRGKI